MNWELICYLLENFSILKKRCRNFTTAENILLLDESSEDLENTIYISADSGISCNFSKALVIFTQQSSIRSDNYICLSRGTALSIANTLLSAKAHLDKLTLLLSRAVDPQEVIDISSSYLDVPFFYFDGSYRILAITKGVDFADDAEWKHMNEKGFLSQESTRRMQESGDMDLLADKRDPFPYNASYFPFESLVCNIWLDDHFHSRMNMLCIHHPSTELNIQECRIICTALQRIAMSSSETELYSGPLNKMVLDLLNGYPLSDELILDRLRQMPQLANTLCQVCCIDVAYSKDPQVLNYYASVISRIFEDYDVLTLDFRQKVVVILHGISPQAFAPYHRKLDSFLKEQGIRGCLSNFFTRFSSLREHYLQALSILEMPLDKVQKPGLIHFDNVFIDYILSYIPREQTSALISYDILKLNSVQPDYQFPLAETLKTYLESGCNLQLTAEKLFIHKNTALYRLNHLRELLSGDLDSVSYRMQLMFSFSIYDKYHTA